MTLAPLHVLGVMSGTSLDGADGVLVRLERHPRGLDWEVLARHSLEYPHDLRERLQQAITLEDSNVVLLTQLHAEVAHHYARLACEVQHPIDLIALSGQTVYHIPRADAARDWYTVSTLQLGEASVVAERCRVPVVSDFRQADMAAGGQGAPLVAYGDYHLFRAPGVRRAVHNLGGISNLTTLPADDDPEGVVAFDTGPANCLLDEAAARYYGLSYDPDGIHAARGRVHSETLARLMQHPYLRMPPPKTTGREVFTLSEVAKQVPLDALEPDDVLATLTAFSAASIAHAYRSFVLPKGLDEVVVAGGGAHNPTLLAMLRARLERPLVTFEELGWQSKDREALAFAVMAYDGYHGLPNTLPRATGAAHPVVAGKLSRPWRRA